MYSQLIHWSSSKGCIVRQLVQQSDPRKTAKNLHPRFLYVHWKFWKIEALWEKLSERARDLSLNHLLEIKSNQVPDYTLTTVPFDTLQVLVGANRDCITSCYYLGWSAGRRRLKLYHFRPPHNFVRAARVLEHVAVIVKTNLSLGTSFKLRSFFT